MEAHCSSRHVEEAVVEKLRNLSLVDRMMLLKKYMRIIESRYRQSRSAEREAIIVTIHRLKFSRRDLIEAYANREAVVDEPGVRLFEFLDAELKYGQNTDIGI